MRENREVAQRRLEALRAHAGRSERSQQTRVGMSEIGGPDCALQHRLLGTPTTNPHTQVLAALRGTALHKEIEIAVPAYEDPKSERGWLVELTVGYDDLLGHVDLAITDEGVVEDAKTKDKDGMAQVRTYGPNRAYIWQNHLYAAALIEAGTPVHTLRWTYYSVSSPDDIYVVEMAYDPQVTAEALKHYKNIKAKAEWGEIPNPQRDASSWCRPFCRFYDATGETGCPGLTGKALALTAVQDEWIDAPSEQVATDYREGMALEQRGKAMKQAAREQLIGLRGVAGNWVVSWTDPKPTETPDKDFALRWCEEQGVTVPILTHTNNPAISVKPLVTPDKT